MEGNSVVNNSPTAGSSVDLIEKGWFMEKNSQWPGQANSIEVKKILLSTKTDYQDLLVFESTHWGKVLVLDGVIQLTERDEMSYQEMMAHLPLFAHSGPLDVLVVGGGDGGVLREVCKHSSIKSITMCEIDRGVIAASKEYFPSVSCSFGDSRVNLVIGDAVGYAEKAAEASYDVIIVDSSDPVGPAEMLFSKEFYATLHRILRPGGVVCSQGECLWVHGDLIRAMHRDNESLFASVEYASIQVPTYPSGQIGAFLARKADEKLPTDPAAPKDPSCRRPRRPVPKGFPLRYYTEEMHAAAFALPAFLRDLLKEEERPSKAPRTQEASREPPAQTGAN